MVSIENSPYKHLILQKLEFPFGNVYLMEDVVVSELFYGVVATSDQVYLVLEKALLFYDTYSTIKKRVWVANRTYKYSVKLVGWLHMKNIAQEYLKGYCVVDSSRTGFMNAILESKFVPINFKACDSLDAAMLWVKTIP